MQYDEEIERSERDRAKIMATDIYGKSTKSILFANKDTIKMTNEADKCT